LRHPPRIDCGEKLWLSEDIGVVDSALTLEAVAAEAAARGVIRQPQDVTKLYIGDGICHGVVADGRSIVAKMTIVATGAWTPALLRSSNIQLPVPFQNFLGITAVARRTDN